MGLDQVKELTRQTSQRIIRFAPFMSVEDFLTRVDPLRPIFFIERLYYCADKA